MIIHIFVIKLKKNYFWIKRIQEIKLFPLTSFTLMDLFPYENVKIYIPIAFFIVFFNVTSNFHRNVKLCAKHILKKHSIKFSYLRFWVSYS